jgi:hypothetical protein
MKGDSWIGSYCPMCRVDAARDERDKAGLDLIAAKRKLEKAYDDYKAALKAAQ